MSDKPRTWTIHKKQKEPDFTIDGPLPGWNERIPVIELESVLDLLEVIYRHEQFIEREPWERARDILREHGRLK